MRAPTLLLGLSLALCSATSFAQQGDVSDANMAEAKKQFAIGTKAFSSGKFPEAAQAFEAAAAARPNAVALYTAALAWEQAPQSERAADDYGRALDLPGGGLNPQQTNTAKERIAALEKTLGTLAVTGPDGYKVQLDQFTEAPVPVRLHGTPGTHTLSVRAPGKAPDKREVLLEGGQTQNMDVTPVVVKKPEAPLPPPPPKEVVVEKPVQELSMMKALGFSAIGVGGAATLTAILLGISALDAGDAYNAAPTHASLVHANALATWTTVSWIAAGVFIAGGVTLVLIPAPNKAPATKEKEKEKDKSSDEARLSVVPTLGGAMLQGAF